MGAAETENKVVVEYKNVPTVTVEDFFKDVLKEMLVADNDTLKINIQVENQDGSLTDVEFNITMTELKQQ